ncbi:post-GPI attachment to proteins factor 3-like, partial [Trifolium medium]|nr:post-GPI attachment to proteins factor 3-like [Trifolium medium]
MLDREKENELLNLGPVKYHGKWPFKRIYGIQNLYSVVQILLHYSTAIVQILLHYHKTISEPASVAFSALNLAMHFHGWVSFFILLYYKLPLKDGKKAYY